MPLCEAEGCTRTALLDSGYCGIHLHKASSDNPLEKAGAAVSGAVLHTLVDSDTLNSGMELTGDLMDKCDTDIGKGIVAVTGFVATEAASMAVQGVKHIGTVVKLLNFFDSL